MQYKITSAASRGTVGDIHINASVDLFLEMDTASSSVQRLLPVPRPGSCPLGKMGTGNAVHLFRCFVSACPLAFPAEAFARHPMPFQFCNSTRPQSRLPDMGVTNMRDLYQVLRQKEMDLERIRREIEALRSVIPLLSDESERSERGRPTLSSSSVASHPRRTGGAD